MIFSMALTNIVLQLVSIYTFSITTISGQTINLSMYKGKKILIVNIATKSKYANQLNELEKLYLEHKDSLVIIAFPSYTFSNEQTTAAQLSFAINDSLRIDFPVVQPGLVKGTGVHPLYKWLSAATDNGVYDAVIKEDFQKFLINKDGSIYGIFKAEVSPVSDIIESAIRKPGTY